jgi:hypothetical protein
MQCAWFSPTSDTEAGEPVAAQVTLPAARHVYDLRAQKYLGRVTQIHTRLRWGRANFFLALPYKIEGIEVRLSSRTPAPGQALSAAVRLGVPPGGQERHAVYVEAIDPQGQPAEWASQVVVLSGGSGQVRLPIAYNDAPGQWRLRVTELFSNQSAEATWAVR